MNPISKALLIQQLLDLGVRPGTSLLVHTAFSKVRPVMERGAQRLEARAAAAQTKALAPAAAMGMAGGAHIPVADPAVLRTRGRRAAVAGGIDLTAAASGKSPGGWRGARPLQIGHVSLLTRQAIGLARASGKRLGLTRGSGRCRRRWSGWASAPESNNDKNQAHEDNTRVRRDHQVRSHHQPLLSGDTWADHTSFCSVVNYPHVSHTRPSIEPRQE